MTTATIEHRQGKLALALQEAFTAAVRLRSNRQVGSDAASFRTQIKHLLGQADQEARRAGYDGETAKLAVYAYIVFLDESVLNSQQTMFADWPNKPLQEEVFGGHTGGEVFFQYLNDLLGRQDSQDLADLLEVYLLCLLLGYEGRYSVAGKGELAGLTEAVSDKIQRIRGGYGELSPSWAPPADEVVPGFRDPWIRRLGFIGAGLLTIAIVLYVIYDFALRSGINNLQALVQ
ncbi:MAG: DotU family type IV/VI secretion system protein [Gemmatimonadota bacterium]|nr:MAG: DotU family type IV/VI secretion system protein [Gemmatimonadota bacterium]